jgi:hypothetical protein
MARAQVALSLNKCFRQPFFSSLLSQGHLGMVNPAVGCPMI